MVRFKNATVTILAESTTLDESGDYIAEWSPVETIIGDVQPHSMTEDEMKLYGISEQRGNVRLFLYNGIHPNVKVGNRAKVFSDFTQSENVFNIMPINAWSRHGECILIPVENEEEITPPSEESGSGENTESGSGEDGD